MFSQSAVCFFILLRVSFELQKFVKLISSLAHQYFLLLIVIFVSYKRNLCLSQCHKDFLPGILGFTYRTTIHFHLISVCDAKYSLKPFACLSLHVDIQLFQDHLVRKWFFLHRTAFASSLKTVAHIFVGLFQDSILLHRSTFVTLCLYFTCFENFSFKLILELRQCKLSNFAILELFWLL